MNIVFHIGLHKTASTTLQSQVFPQCHSLNYLTGQQVQSFVYSLITEDPIYFNASRATKPIIDKIDQSRPSLISHESLSGPLYPGLFKRGLDHRLPILKNLQRSFPEAKIILIIRRQDTLARSIYRQFLKKGGTLRVNDFFALDSTRSPFPINRFLYTPYVDKLVEMFPYGVKVLIFEEFLRHPDRFFKDLGRYIGIQIPTIKLTQTNRTSLGSMGMEFTRRANQIFRNFLNPNGLISGIPIPTGNRKSIVSPISILHDHWPYPGTIPPDSQIHRTCLQLLHNTSEDNRHLDARYHLNLKQHGYY